MKSFSRMLRPGFEDLVECIYCVCKGMDYPTLHTQWRHLKSARRWPDIPLPIDKEDIRTEVWLIWEKWKRKYLEKSPTPSYSMERYIHAFSPFDIKTRLLRCETHHISRLEFVFHEVEHPSVEFEDQIDGGLDFLLGGGRHLSSLAAQFTQYERYLIYLSYIENKSLRDMDRILHRKRVFLSQDIKRLNKKIRRLANEHGEQYRRDENT